MTMPDVITDQAKYKKGWTGGLPETPCGFGSRLAQTEVQRKWIPQVVARHGISSLADIGAGDLNWIEAVELGCAYQAYDLVPRHPDVIELNLLTDTLPQADCLMVLWVLNHFTESMARIAMDKLLNSGSRYLLMTWESRMWDFTDLKSLESVVIRNRNDERGNVEIRLIEL